MRPIVGLPRKTSLTNPNAAAFKRRKSLRPSLKGLGAAAIAPTGTGETILSSVGGVTGTGGVTGAAKGAAAGASIGSLFPGFGTAIGAAIGAIVGGLVHFGTGAQRLATATSIVNELKSQPPPISAGRQQTSAVLQELFGALVTTRNYFEYVSPWPGDSPSDISHEYSGYMSMITALVKQMNATPVGGLVNFSYSGWNGVNFTFSFVNPGTANSSVVAQTAVIPAVTAWCTHNGATDQNNCNVDASNPLVQLVFSYMTDYVIGQNPPPAAQASVAPQTTTTQTPAQAQTAIVTPAQQATVTVQTPATQTAPAATTVMQSGSATTVPTIEYLPSAAAPVACAGLSTTDMLLIAGAGVALILVLKKK